MRQEQQAPEAAYSLIAQDTVDLLGRHMVISGASMIDVGGGPGYTAEALRNAGGHAFTVDADSEELKLHGRSPVAAVIGDGQVLPIGNDALDAVVTLNALEHVVDPWEFMGELVRVVRPGGIAFIGVTNWLSPWGGHETSPWHYFGGERAARRYKQRHGVEAKNRYGESLYPVHIASIMRWARNCSEVTVVDAFPRYYPSWASWIVKVPGLREIATWNLALVLEKR